MKQALFIASHESNCAIFETHATAHAHPTEVPMLDAQRQQISVTEKHS